MKILSTLLGLLLYSFFAFCQNKIFVTEDSTLNKWTHAVINIECTSSPNLDSLQAINNLFLSGGLDSMRRLIKLDEITSNPESSAGTAIFLKFRTKYYLITARHVLLDKGRHGEFICPIIVLVENKTASPNDPKGTYFIDTPITGKSASLSNGITVTASAGNTIKFFSFSDLTAEIRDLNDLHNSDSIKTYFFSPGNDDVGLINITNIGNLGIRFIETLFKKGYKPIELNDLDTVCQFKKMDQVICIGFPKEVFYDFRIQNLNHKSFQADFKSRHMITKGFIFDNPKKSNFFEASIFTYYGFSGGPVILNNKLIGIIHGFNLVENTNLTSTINSSYIYHSRFIKATLVYNYLKKF